MGPFFAPWRPNTRKELKVVLRRRKVGRIKPAGAATAWPLNERLSLEQILPCSMPELRLTAWSGLHAFEARFLAK